MLAWENAKNVQCVRWLGNNNGSGTGTGIGIGIGIGVDICMGFVWVLYGDLGFCMGWRAWPGARTGFPPWFGGPSPDGSCKQVKQKKERKK